MTLQEAVAAVKGGESVRVFQPNRLTLIETVYVEGNKTFEIVQQQAIPARSFRLVRGLVAEAQAVKFLLLATDTTIEQVEIKP